MRSLPLRVSALLLLCGSVSADGPPLTATDPVLESATVRLVTTRVRIEATIDGDAEICRDIGADDLRIRLRGDRLPAGAAVRLERQPVPALHALLIDTSGSMYGDLAFVREAASRYVEQLPERDRAMVMTFDESVVLEHGFSRDTESLLQAIDGVRMGGMTSMHDGIYSAMRELDQNVERPVVLLLTDGFDWGSIYERADINTMADFRRDLIVFTIGVEVPFITRYDSSTKRFMQRLAQRTDGKYFDAPRATRLERVFRQIREALDNEAVVTFTDPDPRADPAEARISTSIPGCHVHVFRSLVPREREDPAPLVVEGNTVHMTPDRVYTRYYTLKLEDALRPSCATDARPPQPRWFVELAENRLDVCALDTTMETGMLYSADNNSRTMMNGYIDFSTRPLQLPMPPLAQLPRAPEQLLDDLADQVRAVLDDEVKTDPRQVPVERHARPYRDIPGLVHGRTIQDLRNAVARAMDMDEEYGAWARQMLREEAERRLELHRERLRRLVPETPAEILDQAVRDSPEGQAILARAEQPADRDLGRFLFAWLGDLSAHELFVRWEALWIDRLLAGDSEIEAGDEELERWSALHRVLSLPSYARTLALVSPVRDDESRRIGFWRVVLPRPMWMTNRLKGWKNREAFSDLPMDFVPDRPFVYQLVRRLRDESPDLFARLAERGYRFDSASYTLPDKPGRQSPENAFEWVRIDLQLIASDDRRASISAEINWPKKRGAPTWSNLQIDAASDQELEPHVPPLSDGNPRPAVLARSNSASRVE